MMKFEELKFEERKSAMNKQAKVFFDNGYGASIIIGPYTYGGDQGLYELAVLEGDEIKSGICYDTPITNDVLGHLTPKEVEETLKKIKRLKKNRG